MLEKIGLPAKPSLRGNSWVVDASHCQGCSSQFTFINRKHHCRRCGGIFCNTCTQQRMVLRGQGDSPVRICDPCKKLEEAARFELRHGHRNRTGRGSSRTVSKNEDEILAQILASDTKGSSSSGGSAAIVVSNTGSSRSSMGSSNSADSIGLVNESIQSQGESESADPKDLRQQALDEKKKYKILKGEGKNEEALKAFKRGKELERQADALEIFLRKSRKRVLPGGNMGQNLSADGSQSLRLKDKSQRSNDLGKDDLMSELRELGWSDMDLHNDDKKSKHISIEGELSALIGEMSQKSDVRRENQGIDRTQITAHKRKALLLKREGKLAEAKEELKKAKLLEKQAEEQELLAGAEDSDDEFSALISSMDDDKQDDLSIVQEHGHFRGALGIDDIDNLAESNFEVTEEDMEDPELASVLKSLGWDEESDHTNEKGPKSNSFDGEALLSVMTPKKEDSSKTDAAKVSVLDSEPSPTPSTFTNAARKPRSKAEIQRELLGLKRKALVLRREGKSEEAEEVLKMTKSLEDQVVELEAPKNNFVEHAKVEASETVPPLIISGEGNEVEVTEDDMHDPALLGILNGLGWKDEEHGSAVKEVTRSSKTANISTPTVSQSEIHSTQVLVAAPRSKAKVQRELLGLKRKALELRRKGEMGEAEEVLSRAKALEKELEELEAPKELPLNVTAEKESGSLTSSTDHDNHDQDTYEVTEGSHMVDRLSGDDSRNPQVLEEKLKDTETSVFPSSHANPSTHMVSSFPNKDLRRRDSGAIGKEETHDGHVRDTENSVEEAHQISHVSLKQKILDHKKRAVALKREGKIAEAREELKQAKLLEKSLEDNKPEPSVSLSPPSVPIMQEEKEKESPPLLRKPLASRERFKIQQESLKHKRQALKLRKEGRIQEAEAETELAKALEAQLEESASHDSNQMSDSMDDVVVEDLLDPELLSALRAVGIANTNIVSQSPEKPEPTRANAGSSNSSNERQQLEEQIKAAKVKAVNLKRSGNQAEALDALRGAKLLEKKLNALESK